MHTKVEVLIASRSKAAMEGLMERLGSRAPYQFRSRHIENGHADPLWGLQHLPDIVVMLLNERGHHDLTSLIEDQAPGRPPMIVIAEGGDAQTMRLAMQAGARDFLPGVVTAEELIESLNQISSQLADRSRERNHRLTVFVNAKGGSGATFIACNVAHISSAVSSRSTALLSLDLQFESLAQYFDTELRHGLMRVLDSVDSLDAVALDAYMTQHPSGLRMLAAQPENAINCQVDRAGQLGALIDKMTAQYEHVVVDMPRRFDSYSIPVIERAQRIVLIVQQTLGHLRDASRMLQIFKTHGIAPEQILVVVNRFEKGSAIATDDVKRALQGSELVIIPGDFKTVAESINLGVPMHEHARGSGVTKALLALERQLGGQPAESSSGFLGRAFANILRKEAWPRA
jgi:pilus assembly protein CpaE